MLTTSENTDKILPALLQAEQAFEPIVKRGVNKFLNGAKYVQLDDLLAAIEAALVANDLLIVQGVGESVIEAHQFVEGKTSKGEATVDVGVVAQVSLTTRLYHAPSGQWVQTVSSGVYTHERGISIAQSLGKVLTYMRRYALTGLLNLSTEQDDDAQPGSRQQGAVQQAGQKPQAQTGKPPVPTMTTEQFTKEWASLFGGDGERANAALSSVMPPGKAWGAVKNDGAWLHSTYTAMKAEMVAAAKKQEDALASELAQLAGDSAAGEE